MTGQPSGRAAAYLRIGGSAPRRHAPLPLSLVRALLLEGARGNRPRFLRSGVRGPRAPQDTESIDRARGDAPHTHALGGAGATSPASCRSTNRARLTPVVESPPIARWARPCPRYD